MEKLLEAYPRLPEVVIYDWIAVAGLSNSFVRLADLRLRCLWMDPEGRLREACGVGILTCDGVEPKVCWRASNHAYVYTSGPKKGKVQIMSKNDAIAPVLTKCKYAFAPLYAKYDNSLEQRVIDTDWQDLSFLMPELFRLVHRREMASPLPNSMYADHTLKVCPEDSPEQFHITHNLYEKKPFSELTEKEISILKERAHAEYIEDLHSAWMEADIYSIGTKCAHGELIRFELCQSGGMVVTLTRPMLDLIGRPGIMAKPKFIQMCKENKWSIIPDALA